MLKEIIEQIINNLKEETKISPEIKCIDYICILPKSEQEKKELESEVQSIAKLFHTEKTGNLYLLDSPLKTPFGEIAIIKIRVFDESKLKWRGFPSLGLFDYRKFKKKYQNQHGFRLIKRPNYELLEYIGNDKVMYFPDILLAQRVNKR